MPSPATIEIDLLLAPIAGDNPAGRDLRYEPIFDEIKEARRADDDLPRDKWVPAAGLKKADWPRVKNLATGALATQGKELQVAAWLVEALVRMHGFAGLRDGLRLLRRLVDEYWESIFPLPEDGDLEFRGAQIAFLNEKVVPIIRMVPMTSADRRCYSWWDYQDALELEKLRAANPEAAAARREEGKISKEEFDGAVGSTSLEDCLLWYEDLCELAEACLDLKSVVDSRFGDDAPSLLDVERAIDDYHHLVRSFVKDKGGFVEPTPEESEAASQHAQRGGGSLPLEPRDRADALERLRLVAEFFRRTEPHSPVSYLVQRAVMWGGMTLDQWLQEVIGNDDVLGRVRDTLGVNKSDGQ